MMIHFLRPLWLLALLPIILYLAWALYASHQNNPWRKLCDAHLLPTLIQDKRSTSRWLLNTLLFFFLTLMLIALAGPTWQKAKLPVYRKISSMIVLLDLSTAMENMDLKPDRLTRAKLKIRDLIHTAKDLQMGLIAFSSEAFVASPLSQDATTLSAILEELSPQMMPISGSDISEGLKESLSLLKQTEVNHSEILLITASDPTANSWNIAKAIHDAGHQLNILAMMEPKTSNQTTLLHLQQLAQMGGGSFFIFSSDDRDIKSILQSNRNIQTIKDANVENTILWQDAGPWFCLLLIPLALLVLREKAA